ncbi:PilW family protein [Pseudomonas sp. JG-B]|uniref:PilW family protein n=1 Tax=Pseudomonas sp. JG-B TaxID=2603214 RepID=UPI00129DB311|nr:type II secretion system protein [Pseudomonas sp. JG-B]MRK19098.1 type II secretion system protein [Pseudomonas sp. JG-B]
MNTQKMSVTNFNKQSGYTLVELMIGMVVAGVLMAGVVAGGIALFNYLNSNDEQQNISQLIANAKGLKSGGGYGATGTNLVPQLMLPSRFLKA